jgi:hypothetical protein
MGAQGAREVSRAAWIVVSTSQAYGPAGRFGL